MAEQIADDFEWSAMLEMARRETVAKKMSSQIRGMHVCARSLPAVV
jgi:hypothetical protein